MEWCLMNYLLHLFDSDDRFTKWNVNKTPAQMWLQFIVRLKKPIRHSQHFIVPREAEEFVFLCVWNNALR